MTKSQFQNIEPRYRKTEPRTPEDRQKIVAEVNAVWERLMPSRRGDSAGGGSLILKPSNGSKVAAEHVNTDGPGMSLAWRRIVEKAQREIAEHTAKWNVRELAAEITVEQLQHDLLEIRTWANSLRKTDL